MNTQDVKNKIGTRNFMSAGEAGYFPKNLMGD